MKQSPTIKKLIKQLQDAKKVHFLFDYDGVLVPLQDDPTKTYLPKNRRDFLYDLSKQKNTKVSLVSGRDLKTLRRLSGIRSKNILMVGSHGLEVISNGKKGFLFKSDKSMMMKVKPKAIKIAKSIADGFVENKPHSFTYHIRDKRKKDFVDEIYAEVKKVIKEEKLSKKLKVLKGKRMVEILPEGITKGRAVEKIIKKNKSTTYIYFGDDVTDVYAFKEVRKYKGIVVSLNPKLDFKADYNLKSPKDVECLLSLITCNL